MLKINLSMSSAVNLLSVVRSKSFGSPKMSYTALFRLVSGLPPPEPAVGGALTSAERQAGQAIASKLENILKDDSRPVMMSDHPGLEPSYPYYHDIDCQFILDSSGSIGYSEFIKGKEATKVSQSNYH